MKHNKPLLFFLSILAVNLLIFALISLRPQPFLDLLISRFGLDAPALMLIGGFVEAIVSSATVVVLLYKELKTGTQRPLAFKEDRPRVRRLKKWRRQSEKFSNVSKK